MLIALWFESSLRLFISRKCVSMGWIATRGAKAKNAERKRKSILLILYYTRREKKISSPDPKWDSNTNSYWKDKNEHKALKDIKIPPIWIITISFSLLQTELCERESRVRRGDSEQHKVLLFPCSFRVFLVFENKSLGVTWQLKSGLESTKIWEFFNKTFKLLIMILNF